MIYILCCCSICANFIFIALWGYAEGNIDSIIHYLGINYPDALEGVRKDYIVRLGHAPKSINSSRSNINNGDDFIED